MKDDDDTPLKRRWNTAGLIFGASLLGAISELLKICSSQNYPIGTEGWTPKVLK